MVGTFDAARVRAETGGAYDGPWTATLNSLVARGGHDLVLSIGQVSYTSSPSGTMKKRGPNLSSLGPRRGCWPGERGERGNTHCQMSYIAGKAR